MKTMKKIYFITVIAMLLLLVTPAVVKADSFQLNVTADKQNIQPGQTVTLTLSVSNINAGKSGINTLEGIIDYDTSIFEKITQGDFKSMNNWSITYNASERKVFAAILSEGVTTNQSIATITFKVKEKVKYTNTSITIKNVTSNNGSEFIRESNKKTTFEIGTKPEEPVIENTITNANTITNEITNTTTNEMKNETTNTVNNTNTLNNTATTNQTNSVSNSNSVNDNNTTTNSTNNTQNTNNVGGKNNTAKNTNQEQQDTTIKPGRLPQTGVKGYIIFTCVVTITGIAVAFISYLKYKKISE